LNEDGIYQPAWQLPAGVHAFVTTRFGGHSQGAWQTFNLADHVNDDPAAVIANRILLREHIGKITGSAAPIMQWVQQVHGCTVYTAKNPTFTPSPQADAIYTTCSNLACVILTADCLPVLFCSTDGQEIAVAHAGWRGLCGGVLEATIASFKSQPHQIMAWLGPAIGSCHFEVGDEVRAAFIQAAVPEDEAATHEAFTSAFKPGKWFADLYQIARIRLITAGINQINGDCNCTFCGDSNFYSHRKKSPTGRFATLIIKTK